MLNASSQVAITYFVCHECYRFVQTIDSLRKIKELPIIIPFKNLESHVIQNSILIIHWIVKNSCRSAAPGVNKTKQTKNIKTTNTKHSINVKKIKRINIAMSKLIL